MSPKTPFTFVTRVRPDSRGRVTLAKVSRNVSSYRVGVDREGRVLLEPFVEIPAREQWLFENPSALASLRRGLAESARGETASLGSFAGSTGKTRKKSA